jgi:sulfite reductase (NADPH) hemoprotein beta-component
MPVVITLGGSAENDAALGDRLGPAIEKEKVADTIGELLQVYVENRIEEERFLDTYRRIGIEPFKERVYAAANNTKESKSRGVKAVASH